MRRVSLSLALAVVAMALLVPSARAAFGVEEFGLDFAEADHSPATLAGSHPFSVTNLIRFNKAATPEGELPDEALRNLEVQLPPGLVGKPGATPRCLSADFAEIANGTALPNCADSSAVGVAIVQANFAGEIIFVTSPVYNLTAPKGTVLKLGITPLSVPVTIQFRVSEAPPLQRRREPLRRQPDAPDHQLASGPLGQPGRPRPRHGKGQMREPGRFAADRRGVRHRGDLSLRGRGRAPGHPPDQVRRTFCLLPDELMAGGVRGGERPLGARERV